MRKLLKKRCIEFIERSECAHIAGLKTEPLAGYSVDAVCKDVRDRFRRIGQRGNHTCLSASDMHFVAAADIAVPGFFRRRTVAAHQRFGDAWNTAEYKAAVSAADQLQHTADNPRVSFFINFYLNLRIVKIQTVIHIQNIQRQLADVGFFVKISAAKIERLSPIIAYG